MSELGISASALGNHELDAGLPELLRQARGECAPSGCLWPNYKGPGFPYLGANVLDAATGKPLLPTHVMKQAGALKVGIAGVATLDTPKVIVARAIKGIRFADEADTLNALVPPTQGRRRAGAGGRHARRRRAGPGRQCQRCDIRLPHADRPRARHRQAAGPGLRHHRRRPHPPGLHLQDRRPPRRAGRQLRRLDHRKPAEVRRQRPRHRGHRREPPGVAVGLCAQRRAGRTDDGAPAPAPGLRTADPDGHQPRPRAPGAAQRQRAGAAGWLPGQAGDGVSAQSGRHCRPAGACLPWRRAGGRPATPDRPEPAARGRQPRQSAGHPRTAGARRRSRDGRGRRPAGTEPAGADSRPARFRRGTDGRADARDGRHDGHAAHPPSARPHPARDRDDRGGAGHRTPSLPGGRHGRAHRQALRPGPARRGAAAALRHGACSRGRRASRPSGSTT
ncbi:hypothetical protein OSTOST_10572 [Ostertagia ostertagi]